MTIIRRHTFEALVAPDVSLGAPASGRLTIDAGRAPLVTGEIVIPLPDEATLELLDPRLTPRILFRVAQGGDLVREFDLSLRKRPVRQGDAEVRLAVASDEALLTDYAPLADIDMYEHAGDLATLCERVIEEALGETVTVDGETADVTPYWDATNLVGNSGFEGNSTAGYVAGVNVSGLTITTAAGFIGHGARAMRYTATAAGNSRLDIGVTSQAFRATPGRTYTFAFVHRSSVARSGTIGLRFLNGDGDTIQTSTLAFSSSAAQMDRFHHQAKAPAGTAYIWPYIITLGNTAGQFHYLDDVMIVESEFLPDYFAGDDADTDEYSYAFAGATNASQSIRTLLIDAPAREALVWNAGQSAYDFLLPLFQAAGLRLLCDETRTWTLRSSAFDPGGSPINIRYGVNLTAGEDVIDRDAALWFDARITRYRWTDRDGIQQERIDSFALNTPHTRATLLDVASAYPGPGRSEYAVRRAQGRGREITATKAADWTATAEQAVSIVLEGAPVQLGNAQAIEFSIDDDAMTVTSRTVDAGEGAWALIPDHLTWDDIPDTVTWDDFETWLETL